MLSRVDYLVLAVVAGGVDALALGPALLFNLTQRVKKISSRGEDDEARR